MSSLWIFVKKVSNPPEYRGKDDAPLCIQGLRTAMGVFALQNNKNGEIQGVVGGVLFPSENLKPSLQDRERSVMTGNGLAFLWKLNILMRDLMWLRPRSS